MRLKKSLITHPLTVVIVLGIVVAAHAMTSRKRGASLDGIAKGLHVNQTALVEASFPTTDVESR
jgi:hypothetical protein